MKLVVAKNNIVFRKLTIICFLVLAACENPGGSAQTEIETNTPSAPNGGLRSELLRECGANVARDQNLINILNDGLGDSSSKIAKKFCDLANTQYDGDLLSEPRTKDIVLPSGSIVTAIF